MTESFLGVTEYLWECPPFVPSSLADEEQPWATGAALADSWRVRQGRCWLSVALLPSVDGPAGTKNATGGVGKSDGHCRAPALQVCLSPAEGDIVTPTFRQTALGKASLHSTEPTPLGPMAPRARQQAGGGVIPAQTAGGSRAAAEGWVCLWHMGAARSCNQSPACDNGASLGMRTQSRRKQRAVPGAEVTHCAGP